MTFPRKWKHRLRVKGLFLNVDGDKADVSIAAAPIIASRVRKLMEKHPDAYCELDEAATEFEGVAEVEKKEAVEVFDNALSVLYDAGDAHDIWIG
jgi:hypothetical protein